MDSIIVSRLSKTYRTNRGTSHHALSNIDLTVGDGEFVSIVGPSGCGKSTLLKIIAGLSSFSDGEAKIDGKPISGPSRNIGVVFQDPLLLEWRSVFENVMVPVEILKLPYKEYSERCGELLKLTGLSSFSNSYPWELSGGMQQRTAICRALVSDPAILLLDEPFGALDAMTREYMNLELLKLWSASRKTVLLITHSIGEAVFLSDRVYVMSSAPGTIKEVVEIDLPRPRSIDIFSTPEFGRYVSRIRRHFTDQFNPALESEASSQQMHDVWS